MKDARFRAAETEYVRLKQALAAGRISVEECERSLDALMLEHEGRHWMLGANSAKWYVWDGQAWAETKPPEVSAEATTVPSAPLPVAPPAIVAPAKTPAHKYVLGCLLGCASPVFFLAGVGIIVRAVMSGDHHYDLGMTLVAAGVFLFALGVVGLLPKVPLPVFIVVYALWILAGFAAMQMGAFRNFDYQFLPDHVFATGIVGMVGVFFGAAARLMARPKKTPA